MQTRSAAWKANRHPDALQYFKEGLGSVFRQWTALELAVQNQWGGPSSAENADEMLDEVYELFSTANERVYKDDVSLLLDDYLEVKFNTICEDESTEQIGEVLVRMFNQCCAGDWSGVHDALGKEYVIHEALQRSMGLNSTGDAVGSDDEEDGDAGVEEDEEEDEKEDSAAPALVNVAPTVFGFASASSRSSSSSSSSSGNIAAPPPAAGAGDAMAEEGEEGGGPAPAEDGWTAVTKPKRSNKKKSSAAATATATASSTAGAGAGAGAALGTRRSYRLGYRAAVEMLGVTAGSATAGAAAGSGSGGIGGGSSMEEA